MHLSIELDRALLHGTSVGGARPKATLADQIRARFTNSAAMRELFARITFNILIGNTDDHARNHVAFWNGDEPTLTPAYDICPYPRSGGEAAQVMAIDRVGTRRSQVAVCVACAEIYHLDADEAHAIIDEQIDTIPPTLRKFATSPK